MTDKSKKEPAFEQTGDGRYVIDTTTLPHNVSIIIQAHGSQRVSVRKQYRGRLIRPFEAIDKIGIGNPVSDGQYKGWILVSSDKRVSIKLLEPSRSSLTRAVSRTEADQHVTTLQNKGFKTARLFTREDGQDLYLNLLKNKFNSKARLNRQALYWGDEAERDTGKNMVFCFRRAGQFVFFLDANEKSSHAYARCIAETPGVQL